MPDQSDPIEIGRLQRRADFLRAAKGQRFHGKTFTLQASRAAEGSSLVRVGFTLTRKVGGAVIRNRARRRLKEAVRLSPTLPTEAGRDYVLVGRIDAIRVPFETLKTDLIRAFESVHRTTDKTPRHPGRTRPERTRRTP